MCDWNSICEFKVLHNGMVSIDAGPIDAGFIDADSLMPTQLMPMLF